MTPQLKLTYFDIRGRAEPIRLALHLADIPFTDERLAREEGLARIVDESLPFFALPVLEVDGKLHAQSLALLRYVGKLGELYPEDPLEALTVDEALDTTQDVGAAIRAAANGSSEDRAGCAANLRKKFLAGLDRMFGSREGPFSLGEQMSLSDIICYAFRKIIEENYVPFLDVTLFDEFDNLQKSFDALASNEKVVAWEEAHSNTETPAE